MASFPAGFGAGIRLQTSVLPMNTRTCLATLATAFTLASAGPAFSQTQPHTMPAGMSHEDHLARMAKDAEVKKRGESAMGFDQDATVHHFLLLADGGAIDVGVKADGDKTNLAAIRTHLEGISREFAKGSFEKPLMTHAEIPAGVPSMEKLKDKINYSFEKTPTGGRVRIKTRNREALQAVHEFLRYQIKEHGTGDSLTPKP